MNAPSIKVKYYILTSLLLVNTLTYSQGYEGNPCDTSTFLKVLVMKKELNQLIYISSCSPDNFQATSSFLKASGNAPAKGAEGDPDGDYAYDAWTCMYAGSSAIDGNNGTAWVEGVKGDGKGELLLITQLDLFKKLEILSGFGENDNLFAANNRPKTINIYVVRAMPKAGGESQCGSSYEALKIVASSKLILKDVNGFQSLPLTLFQKETYPFQGEAWDYHYWLMIELVDVYPGTKYQDTCISEIRNVN